MPPGKARKVVHRRCGKLVATYFGHSGFMLEARHFVRLDGSTPLPGSHFHEQCPHCGSPIPGFRELEIEGLGFAGGPGVAQTPAALAHG